MSTTKYVWVGENVLYETDGADAVTVTYTYAPEGYGNLLSEQRGGVTYTHHYDAQGSTLALTDDTGAVTDTFRYTAWGEEVVRTGTTPTPFRWIGEKGYAWNENAGRYDVRHRSYSPTRSVWLSMDPIGLAFVANLFMYAANNPVVLVDPSGLTWNRDSKDSSKWRASVSGDSLSTLADMVTGDSSNWVCIWPNGPTDRHWVEYPTAECGAVADVRNLTADKGRTVKIGPELVQQDDGYLIAASNLVGVQFQWKDGRDAAQFILKQAGEGANPIQALYLVGHHFGDGRLTTLTGGRPFAARDVTRLSGMSNEFNTYEKAKKRAGPPKCWFTRDANVWGVGCNTDGKWLDEWANTILRRGATAHGTTGLLFAFADKTGKWAWITDRARGVARTLDQLIRLRDWEAKEGSQ